MNLTEHYNHLYQDAILNFQTDNYQIDSLIDSSNDNRYGLTLLLRPDLKTKIEIVKFLDKL